MHFTSNIHQFKNRVTQINVWLPFLLLVVSTGLWRFSQSDYYRSRLNYKTTSFEPVSLIFISPFLSVITSKTHTNCSIVNNVDKPKKHN